VARTLPGAPSARVGSVLGEQAVVVLPAPMLGALPAVLVLAEPCPRMVELEAWADWQGRQVKVERPHKLEAHKGPAEHPPPLAQVESRARGETPRRGATRATRLVDRVEPRRRALARVAVAAPSGASHGNGTNCCLLLLLRWDFGRDGGSVPAVRSPGRLETELCALWVLDRDYRSRTMTPPSGNGGAWNGHVLGQASGSGPDELVAKTVVVHAARSCVAVAGRFVSNHSHAATRQKKRVVIVWS
jgi:hypothetical protein